MEPAPEAEAVPEAAAADEAAALEAELEADLADGGGGDAAAADDADRTPSSMRSSTNEGRVGLCVPIGRGMGAGDEQNLYSRASGSAMRRLHGTGMPCTTGGAATGTATGGAGAGLTACGAPPPPRAFFLQMPIVVVMLHTVRG